ncbi:MAG: hypothetical protein K5787_12995 [Lentisphaeria bacterium]|nr:hypothetical protein [Lentisphaeria bacterium]
MLKTDQIDTLSPTKLSKWWVLLSCMIIILLLPIICFSTEGKENFFFTRSRLFWLHIVWFECIFIALWHAFTGRHISQILNQRQQTGAANVALAYLWYKASLLSIVAWCASIFIPAQSCWQALPIFIQVGIIISFALMIFVTPKTKELQMQGMEVLPENIPIPPQLADIIMDNIPDNCSTNIRKQSQKIAEKIRYSLPQVGKICFSPKYRQLVELISGLDYSSEEESLSSLSNVFNLVNQIVHECKQ